MGDQADDTLTSFKLTTTQLKQYHAFESFMSILWFGEIIIPSEQNSNRAAGKMTRLLKHLLQRCHALAEYCDYGTLKDEMIRDRIIEGMQDQTLSEKLQLVPELIMHDKAKLYRNKLFI